MPSTHCRTFQVVWGVIKSLCSSHCTSFFLETPVILSLWFSHCTVVPRRRITNCRTFHMTTRRSLVWHARYDTGNHATMFVLVWFTHVYYRIVVFVVFPQGPHWGERTHSAGSVIIVAGRQLRTYVQLE